uniref:RsmF rRNA methyltransferase first C-terminal domain-containing protein n=1 Tax=Acetatifactor sp. TaxID=1872090 RepID=UPI004056DC45
MLPEQFLVRMQQMLGTEYSAFLESFTQEKYQALRLNALKRLQDGRSAAELLAFNEKELGNEEFVKVPFHLTEVPWAKDGYYYEKDDLPGKHPYHEAGVYYIQEPSAMAPVTLLEPQPGEQILDLCAAPGGKSTQIAAAMKGEGILICNEIHPARAKILSENVERMGIRNACVTNETPQHLAQVFPEYFDRILVDAPCSGEGMFRKNEVACEEWSPENVVLCGERQDEILDCAAQMLRPGGRLVYSTCTFAPIENEGSISRFLLRHPEFSVVEIDKKKLAIDGDGVPEYGKQAFEELAANGTNGIEEVDFEHMNLEKTLRLWPHRIKGEGHYAAVLVKDGDVPIDYQAVSLQGVQKGILEKELGEYPAFEAEFLQEKLQGSYLKFGDNLYLMPPNMPNLKGLKVLRPGLHIGTLKKNRFEPSHALALTLAPTDVKNVCDLKSTENTINAYLTGQTFSAEGTKGWYLICVDGFSIGWGKLAGGIMKNHYPKGLRKN